MDDTLRNFGHLQSHHVGLDQVQGKDAEIGRQVINMVCYSVDGTVRRPTRQADRRLDKGQRDIYYS